MVELVFPRRTRVQHLFHSSAGEIILLRPDHTYASFTVESFFTGTAPPAAADTVYNLGYWNNTGGDLVIGVIDASQILD